MVAVFVGDHVGLGEGRIVDAEARGELVEEAEVDVDELVVRAVERAHLRAREAAARLHLVAEEDGVHVPVLPAAPLEDAGPELLDAVDDADDAAVLSFVRVSARPAGRRDLCRRVTPADLLIVEWRQLAQTAAVRKQGEQQVDDQRGAAQTAAAESEAAATHAAP